MLRLRIGPLVSRSRRCSHLEQALSRKSKRHDYAAFLLFQNDTKIRGKPLGRMLGGLYAKKPLLQALFSTIFRVVGSRA